MPKWLQAVLSGTIAFGSAYGAVAAASSGQKGTSILASVAGATAAANAIVNLFTPQPGTKSKSKGGDPK